jgi:hypothetical protein
MTDPQFESQTPRLNLPLLFAGQSQKEGFVNEAFARIDALLHCAIEGQSAAPPPNPVEGQCWLVSSTAAGEWTGHAGHLAALESGNWVFFVPRNGMRVLNRSTGQEMHYNGVWKAPSRPPLPNGGTTIDNEARAAVAALLQCLENAGIIPST